MGTILTILVLLTGVTNFIFMERQIEALLSKNLQFSLQSHVQVTETEIRTGLDKAVFVSTLPLLIDQLQLVATRPDDTAAQSKLNAVAQSFLRNGITALVLHGEDGQELARAGEFAQHPELEVPLNLPGQVQLIWDEQLLLRAVVEIKKEGRVVGKVMTESLLPVTMSALKDVVSLGETGEQALCAPFGLKMQCFPTVLNPKIFTLPLESSAGVRLPMTYALAGDTGFLVSVDYRDQEVAVAYAPVADLGLGMVLKIDSAELYAPAWNQLRYQIPLLVGILIIALLLLRWRFTPLVVRLVHSEAQTRNTASIVKSSNDAIVSDNTASIVTSWNAAAERMYGYSAEEMIGQSISLIIPAENTHEDADNLSDILDGNKIEPYETFRIRKDGSTIAVSLTISPIYDENGAVIGASGISRDITQERQASQNIRNLASIIEFSNDAIISGNMDAIITSWNAAAERMYGYSAEEMIGQSISLIIPAENTHEDADNLSNIRDGNRVELYETFRIKKDGSTIWISLSVSPIYDSNGAVIGSSGISRDITQERQAFQNIRNMASIIESSSDSITSRSMDGTITSWNPAAERMYGYSAEEIIGQSVSRLTTPENANENADILSNIRDGNKIEPYETFRIRKDGSTITVSLTISPIYDENGVVIGASSIARDLTKERQAFQNIRNMASIIESSNDAIIGADIARIFTSWNAAAERMFGYSAKEIIGQSVSLIIPSENTQEDANNQSKIRDGYTVEPYETFRIKKDGSTIWISLTVSPIYDGNGVIIGSSGIARDITRDKQVIRHLQKANELRNEFVAVIAHDLRAPMASISGFAHLLIDEWNAIDDEEKVKYLRIITRNTDTLAEFLEDVLQVARIEAAEFSYDINSFNIRALAQRALDEAIGPNKDRQLALTITSDDLPFVLGDEERQWQVLTNLLSNALKFSPAQEPIVIELSSIGDFVQVAVIDRGVGIAQEDLTKLFHKSGRLIKAGNPTTPGHGLGLFICKALVEAQGGRIWCESDLGQGSTFFFTIPVAPSQ